MKKISIVLAFVLCLSVLVGCKSGEQKSTETDEQKSWVVYFISQNVVDPPELSEEAAAIVEALLSSGAWIEGQTEYVPDVSFGNRDGDMYV